jgi:hypothetical protein
MHRMVIFLSSRYRFNTNAMKNETIKKPTQSISRQTLVSLSTLPLTNQREMQSQGCRPGAFDWRTTPSCFIMAYQDIS